MIRVVRQTDNMHTSLRPRYSVHLGHSVWTWLKLPVRTTALAGTMLWIGFANLGAEQPTSNEPPPSRREETANGEAEALVQELLARTPNSEQTFSGTLVIRDAEGKRSSSSVRHTARTVAGGWEDLWEVTLPKSRNVERLIIKHRGLAHSHYLYWSNLKDSDTPILIPVDHLSVSFAGSDFSLFDLGLEFLHWPNQRIIKHRVPTRFQRPCKVLESTPEGPVTRGYAKVLSWIDTETGGLLSAEAFNPEGNRIKRFEVRTIRRNGSLDVDIWNVEDYTKSSLRFGVPD